VYADRYGGFNELPSTRPNIIFLGNIML